MSNAKLVLPGRLYTSVVCTSSVAVFLGDQVKDQDGNVAVFQELGSAPATMSASNVADYHGLLPGNVLMTADVTSAYPQAEISGTETWVE